MKWELVLMHHNIQQGNILDRNEEEKWGNEKFVLRMEADSVGLP
jgi:hypothetical protein